MIKNIFLIVYGFMIGIAGANYSASHKSNEQVWRVTCDHKKYGFQWMTESQLKHENFNGVHCFQGAEFVRVDGIGAGLEHEEFEHEAGLKMLEPIVSQEVLNEK